jgi:uncharacterized cofD-like protein
MSQERHVVVLGGGNGTSHVLGAFLPFLRNGKVASLHALVQMADDGGSTGRLRRQYGVAAVGDLTRCLLALSGWSGDVRGEAFLRALEYRFEGGDFDGHTLRNIFLTALEKSSDLDGAIATMARILQIPKYAGVVPTTLTTLTEQVEISSNGSRNVLGVGQHFISHHVNLQADPQWKPRDVRVVFKEGNVPLNPRAHAVLAQATHIVVAPGHTYGSILPTLALPALAQAVQKSRAQYWVVTPLLTTPQQTSGWRGEDFVVLYQSYIDRVIDVVIANTGTVPVQLVPQQEWVRFGSGSHDYRLVEADIVSRETAFQQRTDTVPRAIVVHDGAKVEALLSNLLS